MKQLRNNTTQTNTERLEVFKGYVLGNRNKISYRTYVMFNNTCQEILNQFLTSRDPQLLLDLRDHTMFLIQIYKFIKENYPNEENLSDIKEKFHYYKQWIEDESDIRLSK